MSPIRQVDEPLQQTIVGKTEWAKKRLSDLAAESLTLEHTHLLGRDENTGVPQHPIAILHGEVPTAPTIKFDAVCLAGEVEK